MITRRSLASQEHRSVWNGRFDEKTDEEAATPLLIKAALSLPTGSFLSDHHGVQPQMHTHGTYP